MVVIPNELQWGHVVEDVEEETGIPRTQPAKWLQWGHVVEDVEEPCRW